MGTEYRKGQIVDDSKVKTLFDERSNMSGINAVMSCAEDEETIRQNKYRDYITRKSLLKYLLAKKSDVLLDYGCGVGRIAQEVAPKVKSVLGLDVSTGMIDKARTANKCSNVKYDVVTPTYDLGEDIYTKIYTCWVLQHISNAEIESYLSKFYRSLKRGGRVVVLEQVRLEESRQSEYLIQRKEEDYIKYFESVGFQSRGVHKVFRVPSYAMDIWKKYKLPNIFLPFLKLVERHTVMRKPEYIEYVSSVMIFEK